MDCKPPQHTETVPLCTCPERGSHLVNPTLQY